MKPERPPASQRRYDRGAIGPKQFEIDAGTITDIASFYAHINRLFMAGVTWKLGESLDALNDVLYDSFGAIEGREPVRLGWKDMDATRTALGREATCAFLRDRLGTRMMFNGTPIVDQLAALENGVGNTYFDIVMQVFAEHPNIEIVPA